MGKATLVNVKHYKSDEEHNQDKPFHLGSNVWGNNGFILENPQKINPVPCLGKLNFWTVPKNIEEQLEISKLK